MEWYELQRFYFKIFFDFELNSFRVNQPQRKRNAIFFLKKKIVRTDTKNYNFSYLYSRIASNINKLISKVFLLYNLRCQKKVIACHEISTHNIPPFSWFSHLQIEYRKKYIYIYILFVRFSDRIWIRTPHNTTPFFHRAKFYWHYHLF